MAGRSLLGVPLLAALGLLATQAASFGAEEVFPGQAWQVRSPEAAGMDPTALQRFASHVGGRGCITRGGFLIFTWGDAAQRGDVASAAKPFYSHFLFKAIEEGRLSGLDEKAVRFEPRLADLNAAGGHKDRDITFRHMANQTSCYGLAEKPGQAYAYNDWQMALFWDLLFTKIWGATYETVDEKVFTPRLTGPLGCQDKPTMMAFGVKNRPGRVAISPRDFCRFGLLYLRGGRWAGKRLLGEAFVKMVRGEPLPNTIPQAGRKPAEMLPGQRSIGSQTIPDNQTDHMGSYNWLWWTNGVDRQGKRHWADAPADAFGAFGHGGIRVMAVLPSLDIVLSWNDSKVEGRDKENEAFRLLLAAVRDVPRAAPSGKSSFRHPLPDRRLAEAALEAPATASGGPLGPKGAAGSVGGEVPGAEWKEAPPADVGMDAAALARARDYALTGGGSGIITRHGKLVLRWGDQAQRYDLKSSTKAIGLTALGLAIADGKMGLADRARKHFSSLGTPPEDNPPAWLDKITLFHLATQTAGFDKPGGYTKLLFEPGTKWSYSDGGPNWLAECITRAYRRDVAELMFERVFTPLGIAPRDLTWRKNSYRPAEIEGIARREFGAGISANVDAMARIGLLYLREGRWGDKQILPGEFVAACRTTPKEIAGLPVVRPELYPKASDHYGLLWWNNADGTLKDVPRDAYWSWGLYDSMILAIPSLDVVAARAGKSWKGADGSGYGKLAPFFGPIAASVKGAAQPATAAAGPAGPAGADGPAAPAAPPYPPSPVIAGIDWAAKETIIRLAPGSDNWPIAWADDGHLYTAYGDGWGFEPKLATKLSLGLCRVEGPPAAPRGVNLRCPTLERTGEGAKGPKASGMLCAGGVLYLFARNEKLSRLAWSKDHGATWTWADWRFEEGLACPAFLQAGQDYAAAPDEYAYVYSFDSASGYEPSDRMILARVPAGRIADRAAYEFFSGTGAAGGPNWTKDIADRAAVFRHKGQCYRSHVSYSPALKRYLWVQVLGGTDTRFRGGLAIFDAPRPWGPWTTACYVPSWDVGPGESASLPTKWMSADGLTVHLVFSGDDSFSVRKATLRPAARPQREAP